MPRYLIVADETLGGKALLDEIASRNKRSAAFTVIVPASIPKEGLTWSEAETRGLAQDRLERILDRLRLMGIEAEGKVADADPFLAIGDEARAREFGEVILSAPSKRSGYMTPNLSAKVESTFGVPVTFVAGEREGAIRETALSRVPLFGGLKPRYVRAVAKLASIEGFRRGDTIVEQGSEGSALYVILDGRVKVTVGAGVADYLTVGDFFGEISLLRSVPRTASVIADGPTRCLVLRGKALRKAMARDKQLMEGLLDAAGARLGEVGRNLHGALSGLVLHGDLLEQLAEAAHVEYSAGELAKGASWGDSTDEYLRRHGPLKRFAGKKVGGGAPSLVAYEKLPEDLKEQNRDLVREIPRKLASAGYVIRPLAAGEKPVSLSDEEIETLAEREHDRWIRLKLAQGWTHGAARDDDTRRHPGMVPWRSISAEERQRRYGMEGETRIGSGTLPESEKEKDRALMRMSGSVLAAAGYTAVKVGPLVG